MTSGKLLVHGEDIVRLPQLRDSQTWTAVFGLVVVVSWLLTGVTAAQETEPIVPQRASAVSFENEVLPILQKNCLACHSASERQGALNLESPETVRKGGDSGPAVIPGKGSESLLLRLASGREEPTMPPSDNDVQARRLTPEELGLIQLWINQGAQGSGSVNTMSPKKWNPIPRSIEPVHAVALSADGQQVALSRGTQLLVYHVPTGTQLAQLTDPSLSHAADQDIASSHSSAHRDLIQALAMNAEGNLLVSGSFREVKVWRRPSDVQTKLIALGTPGQVMAVSPDRQSLAIAGADFVIRLYKAVSDSDSQIESPASLLSGHTAGITSLRFTSDGRQLVSGSLDQTIRVWTVENGTVAGVIETPGPVTALEVLPHGQADPGSKLAPAESDRGLIATGGGDTAVRLWEKPDTSKVEPRTVPAEKLAVSFDHQWQAVPGSDGLVRVKRSSSAGSSAVAGTPSSPQSSEPGADVVEYVINGLQASVGTSGNAAQTDQINWTVTAASVSGGDSPLLLLGLSDGSLELWSVVKQERLARWHGGTASVPQVSISNRGESAASVINETGLIHVWDLRQVPGSDTDRDAVVTETVESAGITALTLSVNQEWLAWSGDDSRIRVKQTSQLEPGFARTINLPGVVVTALGLSNDGSQLIVGSSDGRLRILSTVDGSIQKELSIGEQPVAGCGWWNDQIWVAEHDQKLRFRNREDGSVIREMNLPYVPGHTVFSNDGQRIALAAEGQSVRILRVDSGSEERAFPGVESSMRSLSFSANGEQLLMTDKAGHCTFRDVASGVMRESVPAFVTAGWLSKDQQAWGMMADGHIRKVAQRYRHRLEPVAGGVTGLRFINNDQTLIATTAQGALLGYVVSEGRNHFRANHDGGISALCVASDDQTMATGGVNGTIRFWLSNGNPTGIQEIRGLSGGISDLCFFENNSRVTAVIAGEQPGLAVFEVSTGVLQQKFSQKSSVASDEVLGLVPWSTGDIAIEFRQHTQRIRPLLKKVLSGHSQPVTALSLDPTRTDRLYSGSQDGVLRRWNLQNGQSEQQYNHGSSITSIAIRTDGQRLATSGDSQSVRLWNVNGQQIQEMRGDIRRKAEVTKIQLELNAARSRVNIAKQQVEAAEKEVPVRLEAEKKQNDAVAAAQKDLADKTQALDKATTEKTAAEKAAVESSTLARQAIREKEMAEAAVVEATAVVQQTQARLNRLQQLLNASPSNESIRQRVTNMQAEQTAAQEKQQQTMAAVQTPTQKAQELSAAANQAATKVSELQKPWLDATEAVRAAQALLVLTQTELKLVVAEREVAERLVPTKKEVLTKAEEAVKTTEALLEAANQKVQESNHVMRTCQFSPGGRVLVTAGDFGSLHSWDSETGVALDAYAGHTGSVREVRFLDDQQIASVSDDQTVRIWALSPAWNLERTIGSIDDPTVIVHRVTALDLSRDSSLILVGGGVPSRTGELQVFRISDGTRVFHQPEAHTDVIYTARFSPDGTRIATGSADRFVRIFKSDTGELIRRLEGHTNYVLGVAWKGNGQNLVSCSSDQTIKVWEAENGDQQRTIENFGRPVTSVSFLGESDIIVSSCGDRLVRMHNSANGGVVRNFGGAEGWLHAVAATPDSGFVAAGDAQGKVRIWNGNNGQLVRTVP